MLLESDFLFIQPYLRKVPLGPPVRDEFGAERANSKKLSFFYVFHSPAMVPKSIKNAPRTASEAPKLSPKWQSCR